MLKDSVLSKFPGCLSFKKKKKMSLPKIDAREIKIKWISFP